jgi:hypothetical protein
LTPSINVSETIFRTHSSFRQLNFFTSTTTMHFLTLCTLVILVAISIIGCANGSTCQCICCTFSGNFCNAALVGNITVSSCSSCDNSLCQSTYSSTCVSTGGMTSYNCVSNSGTTTSTSVSNSGTTTSTSVSNSGTTSSSGVGSSSGADTLFEPIYRTFTMIVMSFPLLMYQKIQMWFIKRLII